jgi:hypothetical protein
MGDPILNRALFEYIRDRWEKQAHAEKYRYKKVLIVIDTY